MSRAFRGQTLVNPPDSHSTLPSAGWCFTRSPDWLSARTGMAAFQLPLTPTTAAMKSNAATNAVRYAWRAEQIEACDGRLERRGGGALRHPGGSSRAASR